MLRTLVPYSIFIQPLRVIARSPCDEAIHLAAQRKNGLLRCARNDVQTRLRDLAARCARGLHLSSAPRRAWGMPGARCTRSPVCSVESTRVVATGTPESPGIPARNGFNGLCRALPGDRALLPPSSRGYCFVTARLGQQNSANLTPASGRQDHTILPSAATSLVSVLLIAHRFLRTHPAIPSRAKRCRVHRIPSRVRDDRDTPLWWGGMRKILDVIWGEWEQKYFRKIRNKTRQPCQQNARRANHLSQSCRPLSVFARVPDGNPSVIPRCAIAHRGRALARAGNP